MKTPHPFQNRTVITHGGCLAIVKVVNPVTGVALIHFLGTDGMPVKNHTQMHPVKYLTLAGR